MSASQSALSAATTTEINPKEDAQEEPQSLFTRLSDRIGDTVMTAWCAGLGAAVITERTAMQTFEKMVKEGQGLRKQARKRVDKRVDSVKDQAEGVRLRAVDRLHDIEERIDNGFSSTLQRFGVPTRKDFEELSRLVNELSCSVDNLAQQLGEKGSSKRSRTGSSPAKSSTTSDS